MERLRKNYRKKFGRRFYTRATLREIYVLLANTGQKVDCEIGEYRIDNVAEIDAVDLIGVKEISFGIEGNGYYNGVGLTIEAVESTVRVGNDRETTMMGLGSQLGSIVLQLRRSRIRLRQVLAGIAIVILGIALGQIASILTAADASSRSGIAPLWTFGVILPLMALVWTLEPKHIKFSDAIRESTFWSRKKDDILLGIGGFLLGSAASNLDRIWALLKQLFRGTG